MCKLFVIGKNLVLAGITLGVISLYAHLCVPAFGLAIPLGLAYLLGSAGLVMMVEASPYKTSMCRR